MRGNAKTSNTHTIRVFQDNIIRKITNAPPDIYNLTLHSDLTIKTVHEKAVSFYKKIPHQTSVSHQFHHI